MNVPGGQPVAGLCSPLLLLALWGEPAARIWPLFPLSHICLVFLKQTEKLSCFFGAAEPSAVPRSVPCLAPGLAVPPAVLPKALTLGARKVGCLGGNPKCLQQCPAFSQLLGGNTLM